MNEATPLAHTDLADEAATVAFGQRLARTLLHRYAGKAVVFMNGQLGAGKTTMVRGILTELGHSGVVKSPTYTLLEPYELDALNVFHFDLYRVGDPQELEFIGFDEIIDGDGIKLFEWPERARRWLPAPDVVVTLTVPDQRNERGEVQRRVTVEYGPGSEISSGP
jgi:tRNA threonylcarbamoyladenosine biosynthesis protein TsaE